MNGKTYLIKGTINGKAFMIWSTSDAELELDFEDAAKDFTVNGNDIALNFKIHIDAIMAKLITLANQNLFWLTGMEMESLKLVLVMTMVIRTLGQIKIYSKMKWI
jgi:hypothetical protein